MKKVNPLIEHITETLRARILSGEYPSGYKLSENKYSIEFECSRTPVREALKRLERDNIVEIKPQSGSYVKAFSDKEYRDLIEVRSYLEALAFRLAVEKKSNISRLVEYNNEMSAILRSESIDFVKYGKVHYLFHKEIVNLSKNELLLDLYERLNLNTSRKIIYDKMSLDEIASTEAEHQNIVNLLSEGKSIEGSNFMINHLFKKREHL